MKRRFEPRGDRNAPVVAALGERSRMPDLLIVLAACLLGGCRSTYLVQPEDHVSTITTLTERGRPLAVEWTDDRVYPPTNLSVYGPVTPFAVDSFHVRSSFRHYTVRYEQQPEVMYKSRRGGMYDGAKIGGGVFGGLGVLAGAALVSQDDAISTRDAALLLVGGGALFGLPAALIGGLLGLEHGRRSVYVFGVPVAPANGR